MDNYYYNSRSQSQASNEFETHQCMDFLDNQDDFRYTHESIINQYIGFLDDQRVENVLYTNLLKEIIKEGKCRLIVNIDDLWKIHPVRARSLMDNALDEIERFQIALKHYVQSIDPRYAKRKSDFFVGFKGDFGNNYTTPRTLNSDFFGKLVCLEGIVTKASLVKPIVLGRIDTRALAESTRKRAYSDITSFDPSPASAAFAEQGKGGNLSGSECSLFRYVDRQTLLIQEFPGNAPAGLLPRSVEVICDSDLVDQCKPGDQVEIVGCYRCLPNNREGYPSGSFRTVLVANNIMQQSKPPADITHDDLAVCKKFAKDNSGNIFEILSQSLAPSILGHEYVKKAILCSLVGGDDKISLNGTTIKGDINVLLIEDPPIAKSQLLRDVLRVAPRAIVTTGRGFSGVGLTATVTVDPETNEKYLEAGAMVMADKGVICIDEFDKMSDTDKTTIHEVMEQGKVTITKSEIHASLDAKCSVLAAASPVSGQYNQYRTPMENIGLENSLLSQFDLVYLMLDTVNSQDDLVISEHVASMMSYRNTTNKTSTKNSDAQETEEDVLQVYETYDPLLHGKSDKKSDKILTAKFMRKYIHIVRCMKPKLTKGACEAITQEYSRLRKAENVASLVARTQRVTARTLDTLVRLSSAHARSRISKKVEVQDVKAIIGIVQFAYFKRIFEEEKTQQTGDGIILITL
ncbi:hypothetical protein QAD02_010753 [Eretmocerus hayati]|uniref:Uncharacterized protein n=1 Tax=Eretmocerus hayati TaxID=131215 RepID=A0ACC2NXN5_9HYME|nr:hypothetical protein QAD02_010753 [Eretmocerus hayati]